MSNRITVDMHQANPVPADYIRPKLGRPKFTYTMDMMEKESFMRGRDYFMRGIIETRYSVDDLSYRISDVEHDIHRRMKRSLMEHLYQGVLVELRKLQRIAEAGADGCEMEDAIVELQSKIYSEIDGE